MPNDKPVAENNSVAENKPSVDSSSESAAKEYDVKKPFTVGATEAKKGDSVRLSAEQVESLKLKEGGYI